LLALCTQLDEVAFCRALHPEPLGPAPLRPAALGGRGLQVLDACGLLTSRTVLAHCVHLSPDEVGGSSPKGVPARLSVWP